jgi:transcriptional regulator with XRE-family HTH domain
MFPIEKARRERNLSQGELARQTGVHQATISRAELGLAPVSRESAAVLAKFFGFPWDERHFLYPERYPIEDASAQDAEAAKQDGAPAQSPT